MLYVLFASLLIIGQDLALGLNEVQHLNGYLVSQKGVIAGAREVRGIKILDPNEVPSSTTYCAKAVVNLLKNCNSFSVVTKL